MGSGYMAKENTPIEWRLLAEGDLSVAVGGRGEIRTRSLRVNIYQYFLEDGTRLVLA